MVPGDISGRVSESIDYQLAELHRQLREFHNTNLLERIERRYPSRDKEPKADIASKGHGTIARDASAGRNDRSPGENPDTNGSNSTLTSIIDNVSTATPSMYLAGFKKFTSLPAEIRRRVFYFAVKDLASSDLRSNRILTGGPKEYCLPKRAPAESPESKPGPLFNLRAVNKTVRQDVEEILYRENVVVFDMDRDGGHFDLQNIGAHDWFSNQAEKSLEDVRQIYVVATCNVQRNVGINQPGELICAFTKADDFQAALRYTNAVRSKLPGLQRATIRINLLYPMDIDVNIDVSALKAPFVDIFRAAGLRGRLEIDISGPAEVVAETRALLQQRSARINQTDR